MRRRPAPDEPINRILTCPHCGPTLTEPRLRCDRCGGELVYITEHEFSGREKSADAGKTAHTAAAQQTASTRLTLTGAAPPSP